MRKLVLKIYTKFLKLKWKISNASKFKRYKITSEVPNVRGKIETFGHGKLTAGKDVVINSSLEQNPIGGMEKTVMLIANGAHLEIGEGTGISNSAIVCKKHIKIGKNVRIGGNTCIYDTDFHSLNLEKRISKNDDDIKCKDVEIKDGAFIGAHSIILKGITIGENSIVGAGSVVSKDIPDGEIWAGNPVKFIKKVQD